MNVVARRFTLLVVSALVLGALPSTATAAECSGKQRVIAQQLGPKLMDAVMNRRYAEGEAIYQQLIALDAACLSPFDHTLGGNAARKLGDLHNAYGRYRTANNGSAIRELDGAYGSIRINATPVGATPRTLHWPGVLITTGESGLVVDRTKALIAGPNRVVGYLPIGHYSIRTGATILAEFDVKAGETTVVSY